MSELGTVGKYTLRRILGKGAMGVVYEAFDPMIERTVALKTIRKDLWEAEDGDELRERFLREARAAGRLLHPNIVTVYEFGETDGGAFIVMEHVAGQTLKELIDTGKRFTVAEAVEVMVPVLSALGYSHRAGVVHRDIKPANVMETGEGVVKILDFGVARLASASITQVGTILGTPAYMAPEQLMGQTVDSRADLYSAGVILRELLCGQKTFTGDYGQVLHQVLHGEPARPSALNPAVPAGFDAIVARAMARQPDERYASAEDFIAALRHPPAAASAGRSVTRTIAAGLALLVAAGAGGAYQFGLFGGAAPQPVAAKVEPPPAVVAKVESIATPPVPSPVAEKPSEPVAARPPAPPTPEPAPADVAPPPAPVAPAEPVQATVETPKPEAPPLTEDAVVAMLAKPEASPPPVAAKPRPPAISVVTDRGAAPRYKVGETMQVLITPEQQSDVYCFYQSAGGEIVRVFPTRFAPEATVKAKQQVKLPGRQPFAFQFDRKASREEIRCLAVEPSVAAKLPKLFSGPGFESVPAASMTALLDTVRRAAGEEISVGGVVVTVE